MRGIYNSCYIGSMSFHTDLWIQWTIPQEMIPGRWSDFDFWKQFFDERIEFTVNF